METMISWCSVERVEVAHTPDTLRDSQSWRRPPRASSCTAMRVPGGSSSAADAAPLGNGESCSCPSCCANNNLCFISHQIKRSSESSSSCPSCCANNILLVDITSNQAKHKVKTNTRFGAGTCSGLDKRSHVLRWELIRVAN